MREKKWRWPADLHPQTAEYWAEVQEIERDILLLYYELAGYCYIMGDLNYHQVHNLPYWDYLNPNLKDNEGFQLIQEGCLVMILAMAWDEIDGSGAYLCHHIDQVKPALKQIYPENDRTEKLLRTVKLAVETASTKSAPGKELQELSQWVHQEIIGGFFKSMAERFQ